MKVIALVGAENTGKSHTINLAYAFLLRDGYIKFQSISVPWAIQYMRIV
ncbi:hypothetical protein ACFSMX_05010 [Flectobacillus roseus]